MHYDFWNLSWELFRKWSIRLRWCVSKYIILRSPRQYTHQKNRYFLQAIHFPWVISKMQWIWLTWKTVYINFWNSYLFTLEFVNISKEIDTLQLAQFERQDYKKMLRNCPFLHVWINLHIMKINWNISAKISEITNNFEAEIDDLQYNRLKV